MLVEVFRQLRDAKITSKEVVVNESPVNKLTVPRKVARTRGSACVLYGSWHPTLPLLTSSARLPCK